ncbi:putative transcription factor WRKY family [Rosa chinensis]|uniref:Putative transcription factor WRKY family n=1 Tax=Rosa chinensis TaxID=74649 RepID=A0A2P6SNG9_ROSCH|nr:probable WRKY transcription factor 27 [Rosa chinensis]PRQ60203.1 putative transcription factor WRKY family [Rosa chinensis]
MEDDDWDLYAVVRSCKAVTTARASLPVVTAPNPVHHDNSSVPSWMWDWVKHEEVETHVPPVRFSNLEFRAGDGLEEFYQPFFPSPTIDNTTATTITTGTSSYAPAGTIIPNSSTSFISDFGGGSTSSGQHQLQQQQNNFMPANTNTSPHFNPGFAPVSGLGRFPEQQLLKPPKLETPENLEELIPRLKPVSLVGPAIPPMQIPPNLIRPRKRKSPVKKMVCHLAADNLSSSDLWAWRKYGQKPIKGSPHPRNYYRCSSSKGCSARKQVERSTEDPNMFVVTYCGDHSHPRPTHRNSLAGSTRNKAAATTSKAKDPESPSVQLVPAQGGDDDEQAANSNSGDGDKASEEAEDEEMEEDEDDEEFVVSSEDIFLGMKQLGRTGSGGSTLGSLAAGTSGDGFSTKQSNLGSSWGASCSSSAGATVSGGC